MDLDAPGSINGVPLLEVDLDSFEDKPWRKPGNALVYISQYVVIQSVILIIIPICCMQMLSTLQLEDTVQYNLEKAAKLLVAFALCHRVCGGAVSLSIRPACMSAKRDCGTCPFFFFKKNTFIF